MDKATRDNRSRQLNPEHRTYHLGRDNNRANQLNPNNDAYWRSRGGRAEPASASEGGGWGSLLTAVGVAAAALAAFAFAASSAPSSAVSTDADATECAEE
jgi:hypothetical protein